jgi:MoaA/NifB/PqqE/SkfB family radical SAM enzyme
MSLATWHWHIEISSKCTLKCPRCARQEVPDTLVNTELDLEFFKRNFTPEFIMSNVEKITFCGDDGDPIYAHDLIPVIRYIKSIKPVEIVIVTNGSHKKTVWWTELGSILGHQDTIHFSIDGWDNDSNNQYRVNSDYDGIIAGMQALRAASACRMIWDLIVFSFNEFSIDRISALAQSVGCDSMQLTKSTKFGSIYPSYGQNDKLEPQLRFVSKTQRFERLHIAYNQRRMYTEHSINFTKYAEIKGNDNVVPLCEIGNKGLYIDARGRLFPCCWVANRYSHNNEWQELASRFNLQQRTLIDVLSDPFWETEFRTFRWQECQTKCSSKVVDEKYATQW